MPRLIRCCWLTLILLLLGIDRVAAKRVTVLRADRFGAVGDGKTDDGPAVLRMLDAAAELKSTNRLELHFASRKTFFLKTGRARYAFLLNSFTNLTLNGGDSLFLIDAQQRFLQLTNSQNIIIRNLKIDYSPVPFMEGTVVAKNRAAGWMDVLFDGGDISAVLGKPTYQDGEQLYFGALWRPGVYSTKKAPYMTREFYDIAETLPAPSTDPRAVRVMAKHSGDEMFDRIEIGKWRASLPVRGVAHRFGPGASCDIEHNENVAVENVELWSAPWFAFTVIDNSGQLKFQNVNVRPPPGTTRIMSSWRDGFHVKNNRASILWEKCALQGMGDDAFNIACHASTVREIKSPTKIVVSQNFPLGFADIRAGDSLAAYDEVNGLMLGRTKIDCLKKTEFSASSPDGIPPAPNFELTLAAPIPNLAAGKTLVWDESSANPHNVICDCRIDVSCRFRSPVTIEHSQINTFMWFTADDIEAPVPRDIVVKNSVLRLGQGNPNFSTIIEGPVINGKRPNAPVIFSVLFENNQISGGFRVRDSANVMLKHNQFIDPKRPVEFKDVREVTLENNWRDKIKLAAPDIQMKPNELSSIKILNN